MGQSAGPDFKSLRENWIRALENQDLEQSLALYATDATFTNPDGTHASGEGLRKLYQTVFKNFRAKITMNPRSTNFSGVLAYEAGSFEETIFIKGSNERKHSQGDYLTLYRQASKGKWLIVEQVWTQAPDKH